MISSDESLSNWKSDKSYGSIAELESDNCYTCWRSVGFRTKRSEKHKPHEHKKKRLMIKRVRKGIKIRSKFCDQLHFDYSSSDSDASVKKQEASSKKPRNISSDESINLISSDDSNVEFKSNVSDSCKNSIRKTHSANKREIFVKSEKANIQSKSDENKCPVIDLISSDESNEICHSNNERTPCETCEFAISGSANFKESERAQPLTETKLKSPVPNNNQYPSPPPGVHRWQIDDASVIQTFTEHLKYPCISLDKITEIRGLQKTHYYCEVCDFSCSIRYILVHIETFQHRLKSLKPHIPLIYDNYAKQSQCQIENDLNKTIKTLADVYGCGKIKVEKEYLDDAHSSRAADKQIDTGYNHCSCDNRYSSKRANKHREIGYKHYNNDQSSCRREKKRRKTDDHQNDQYSSDSSSTTEIICGSKPESCKRTHNSLYQGPIPNQHETFFTYNTSINEMPSTSRSNFHDNLNNLQTTSISDMHYYSSMFYCEICKIHIETRHNWEMHLSGRKHIAKSRKVRGDEPMRRQEVLIPNARASLMDRLDAVEEPVVGLDMINETQDSDAPAPRYTCLLCLHNTTAMAILSHILSLKHRIKYLEKIRHHTLPALKDWGENELNVIVRNICSEIEAEKGRGHLNVFLRI